MCDEGAIALLCKCEVQVEAPPVTSNWIFGANRFASCVFLPYTWSRKFPILQNTSVLFTISTACNQSEHIINSSNNRTFKRQYFSIVDYFISSSTAPIIQPLCNHVTKNLLHFILDIFILIPKVSTLPPTSPCPSFFHLISLLLILQLLLSGRLFIRHSQIRL